MIISIWRYSHLALAISSFVFIAIAAITGVILAVEPISYQLTEYQVSGAGDQNLAQTITHLQDSYEELLTLEVDDNGFVVVSAIDQEGNMGDFYIDPFTGEKLGELMEKKPIYEFATSLHRSLFLKGIGRFFVGLSSFLLLLIALTGLILVIKRQQGIKHFFDKIIKENFFQYYHVYLGRLALIPIIIITLTGTYLSLQRFEVIPEGEKISYEINYDSISEEPKRAVADFPVFQKILLKDVRSVEFPFSTDVEDPYTVLLQDRELAVNQVTGDVLGESKYPMLTILADLSMTLHTGRGSIWWSVILGLASCSILFFIYSGFQLTFARRKSRIKNKLGKDDCEYIILIGSETGTTIPFAMQLHLHLLEQGKSSYVTEMNRFTTFKNMKHLVIITSTYGQGEPPANATKFLQLYSDIKPPQAFTYSVVGFGSLAYADFCQYAFDVDSTLQADEKSTRILETHTINNRSWESFRQWARDWGNELDCTLELPAKNPVVQKRKKKETFEVVSKTSAQDSPDDTFLVTLRAKKNKKLKSGDLIAIYPPSDPHERLYSMAITQQNEIVLSVKRHTHGICSNFLNDLQLGASLEASLVKNKGFHFPKKARRVIMISTGTGIAPFLGMIAQNTNQLEAHLYWGGRNEESFRLYQDYIDYGVEKGRLKSFKPAYSRAGEGKTYVQHLVKQDADLMAETLAQNGIVMICGSIAMQREIIDLLEQVATQQNGKPLSYYQNREQLRMDCY